LKSILLNILNIALVVFILIIIYLLVSNYSRNSSSLLSEFTGKSNDQASKIISIKQIDSLTASNNLHFSKYYAANLLANK